MNEKLPKASWKLIGPAEAEEMLKQVETQRKLISGHVQFLAREMKEGRWKINGDTIRFAGKKLYDGQHRLHAVIQSGVSIWVLIVEELPEDVFDSIDTGRMRQAGDVLSTYNMGSNPFLMAAAARFLWYYEHSVPLESSARVSNHEIVEIVKKNSVLRFLADYMARRKPFGNSSVVAALCMINKRVGRDMTMFFAEKLVTGGEIKADDPIRHFRDKWLMEGSHRSTRSNRAIWIAVLIKTFNAWLARRKVSHCEVWRLGEKFPDVAKTAAQAATATEEAA